MSETLCDFLAEQGLVLSAGFEYNRNNLFDEDARAAFRIDYNFGKKS